MVRVYFRECNWHGAGDGMFHGKLYNLSQFGVLGAIISWYASILPFILLIHLFDSITDVLRLNRQNFRVLSVRLSP